MARVNTAAIVSQLQALGISMGGARQLITAQVLSNGKDRKRLALLLTGLFEGQVIHSTNLGGRSAIRTQSGIIIEFQDDTANQGSWSGGQSSTTQGNPSTSRTRTGISASFEDNT
jgi:hypothetical protein